MTASRETRERLEQVQTRLRDIVAEVELAQTPGFPEQLAALEAEVKLARHGAKETRDRLNYLRSAASSAQQAVDALNLAKQVTQTWTPPWWLSLLILGGVLPALFWAIFYVTAHRVLSAPASFALSFGCTFGVGLVLRARALPRKLPKR
jgi:hypothetical protein